MHVRELSFEVGEWRGARGGVRHHFVRAVNKALLEEFREDPPHRFHVPWLHCLVVVLEVDPSPKARHNRLPL